MSFMINFTKKKNKREEKREEIMEGGLNLMIN
jgi:hypothetical protein